MANALQDQVTNLKAMIESAKQQVAANQESALQQLRSQMEKEKAEVSLLEWYLGESAEIKGSRDPALSWL